jgi:hypothetical protein
MSFLKQIFGVSSKGANSTSRTHSVLSPDSPPSRSAASDSSTRRELLRVVLRNTLNRHGIPTTWIGAEMLMATSRGREPGIHWRLVIRHWDPRLLTHAVALQNALIVRVLAFDPLAAQWLMGISWQFSLPDESLCPPLPHPGTWTSEPRPADDPKSEADTEPIGGSGDVIAGPVRIAGASSPRPEPVDDDVKADLERLFAVRDAEMELHARRTTSDATQPMYLKTEPQPLEGDPSRRRP